MPLTKQISQERLASIDAQTMKALNDDYDIDLDVDSQSQSAHDKRTKEKNKEKHRIRRVIDESLKEFLPQLLAKHAPNPGLTPPTLNHNISGQSRASSQDRDTEHANVAPNFNYLAPAKHHHSKTQNFDQMQLQNSVSQLIDMVKHLSHKVNGQSVSGQSLLHPQP